MGGGNVCEKLGQDVKIIMIVWKEAGLYAGLRGRQYPEIVHRLMDDNHVFGLILADCSSVWFMYIIHVF